MSDPAVSENLEWQPLVPENPDPSEMPAASDAAAHPEPVDRSFQLLYEIPEDTEPGRKFIPFYGPAEPEEERADPETAPSPETVEIIEETPEEVRQRAHEEGLAQGKEEGFEKGKAEAVPILEQMQALLQQIDGLWRQLAETYEEKILQLVGRVSEKVVCAQVAVDSDTVRRVILDAFRMTPEPAEVTIEIHPQDAEKIETVKETFFEEIKTLKHVSVLPDPSVSPGGCRIKTRFGEVDATLESRLTAIQDTIMNVYRNKGKHGGGT